MDGKANEEWLEDRQDGRVFSVGRALRASFDADNHDSLGGDVTGLMIDLSKLPYEAEPVATAAPMPLQSEVRPSILGRLTGLIGRR